MYPVASAGAASAALGRQERGPLGRWHQHHCILVLIVLLLAPGPSWSACGLGYATDASAGESRTVFGWSAERVCRSLAPVAPLFVIATSFDRPLRSRRRTVRCATAQAEAESPLVFRLQQYRAEFFIALAAIIVQASLIILLLMERRRRRTAEFNASLHLAELGQMNRAAALGEMSAAIAHELGQPLAAILTNAETAMLLLGQEPPRVEDAHHALHGIVRDNQRATAVMRRITALYRNHAYDLAQIDVNELVTVVARMNEREAAHRNVEMTLDLGTNIPSIKGDRIQLEQVVFNLLRNAMDAIPDERALRRIVISTREDKHCVRVAVSDSGIGIPENARAQVFEPFFSTKNNGIGMGLAVSKRIVEAHDGRIEVFHSPMGGAQLAIELPTAGVP